MNIWINWQQLKIWDILRLGLDHGIQIPPWKTCRFFFDVVTELEFLNDFECFVTANPSLNKNKDYWFVSIY